MSLYEKARSQKFLSFTLVLFVLATGIVAATFAQTGVRAARETMAAPDATPLVIPSPVQMKSTFAAIAKAMEPSVVNISTEYRPVNVQSRMNQGQGNGRRRQAQPNADDPQGLLQRFFGGGGFGDDEDSPFAGPAGPSRAVGSGVVIDKNGYILTNNHVVDKATRIEVTFPHDGTKYPAKVIGTDSETDLAVIHIDKPNTVAAKVGNSDALQVGDWAIAVGSPFGFEATVTAGIVSALSRDVDEPAEGRATKSSFQHFIQTDAAINPGNSGGPLLNANGEVIGINTMIATKTGGYEGIGFALPINVAARVYNQIIKEGRVTRGSIGISFKEEDSNADLLKVYGASHGILVSSVTADGPAEKAGLKEQDVISFIDNKPVKKGQDLIDMVAETPVGSTLKLGVVRDGKPITVSVVIGDRQKVLFSKNPEVSRNDTDQAGPGATTRFGMSVEALTPAKKQELGYRGLGNVVVNSVDPDSFADDKGIIKGDIIAELNRKAVNSPTDVKSLESTLKPGDSVVFHIYRRSSGANGAPEWVPLFPSGKVPSN